MTREEIWQMTPDEIEQAIVKEIFEGELKNQSLWIDGELMRDEFYPTISMSDAWAVVETMMRVHGVSRKAGNEFCNFLIHPENQDFWDKAEDEAAFTICAFALIAVREAS